MRQLIIAAAAVLALSIAGQAHAGLRITPDMQSAAAVTVLDSTATDRAQLASAE